MRGWKGRGIELREGDEGKTEGWRKGKKREGKGRVRGERNTRGGKEWRKKTEK